MQHTTDPNVVEQSATTQAPADSTVAPVTECCSSQEEQASSPYKIETLEPPVFKRYAHHGKRRRSYTEEMFRCQFTDMISRTPLICNHLLWKNKPDELREHLLEHLKVEEVQCLTDDQVKQRYADAKRIFLEGIPEDEEDDYASSEGEEG